VLAIAQEQFVVECSFGKKNVAVKPEKQCQDRLQTEKKKKLPFH
jgi:hypothetical protein